MEAEIRRFYLDEDVPDSAARVARGLGLDVVASAERGNNGREDAEQLAAAASESRILVTYNRDDFIQLTLQAFAGGKPHFGVLVLTRKMPRDAARVAHALERWCREAPPLPAYAIAFLSE